MHIVASPTIKHAIISLSQLIGCDREKIKTYTLKYISEN